LDILEWPTTWNSEAPTPGKGSNTGVFQMGLGLDVRVTHTLSVRGQVRDFWSGRPDLNLDTDKSRQHNFFVGGGVIWRFGKG
jgi:hypothetical protein